VAEPRQDWRHAGARAARSRRSRFIPIASRPPAPSSDRGPYNAVVHAIARIVREALAADRESDSDKLG
jgi:hypothetical protein